MIVGRKIAVCCPGPSLPDFHLVTADWWSVVAVNRAVLGVPATHWVFLDAHIGCTTLRDAQPKLPDDYCPDIICRPACYEEVSRRWTGFRDKFTHIDLRQFTRDNCGDYWTFSATSALKWAQCQEPNEIHLFGMDMVGKEDWDGTILATNERSEARWERERAMVSALIAETRALGIEVVKGAR